MNAQCIMKPRAEIHLSCNFKYIYWYVFFLLPKEFSKLQYHVVLQESFVLIMEPHLIFLVKEMLANCYTVGSTEI